MKVKKRLEFGDREIERESMLSLETMDCVDALVKDEREMGTRRERNVMCSAFYEVPKVLRV